jgi:hypothetical protein
MALAPRLGRNRRFGSMLRGHQALQCMAGTPPVSFHPGEFTGLVIVINAARLAPGGTVLAKKSVHRPG